MANVKIFLRKKNTDKGDTYPLTIRVTKDRKSRFSYVGHSIKESDWDKLSQTVKKSHPNHKLLNLAINTKRNEVDKLILEMENKSPVFSLEQVKHKMKRGGQTVGFFELAKRATDEMEKLNKIGVASSEKSRINGFKDFLVRKEIQFHEIDVALLEKFRIHLKAKGRTEKTINNYFISIRTLYNRAIREGIVDRQYYPFGGRDKVQLRQVEGKKVGLEIHEIQKLIGLNLKPDCTHWHVRNVFLLSFNFAGMRISDLLKLRWPELQNDRLHYTMGKTSSSVSIPIPDQAKEILSHYKLGKKSKDDLVLPYLKLADFDDPKDLQRKINSASSNINKRLKELATFAEIDKNLTNHIARHTFGNIAGDKIPIPVLQKLYRHKSMNTTAVYQGNFMNKDSDEALLKVVNF